MIHGVMPGALLSTLSTLLVVTTPDVLCMFALEKLQAFSTPKSWSDFTRFTYLTAFLVDWSFKPYLIILPDVFIISFPYTLF